ncbi:thermonuclease family protein [Neorhizobium sp. JUb45]|uniref:thermonuclease family protein n=1 Tax=Neorhizobium sp. JUb45 TaxID=2485113 RepID=UPI00104819E4|nr:thermonuclease family protein [Neorhizobium sp. JUb45]TCQ99019.1 nuclease-like protein [Neorhizobium sp. JUb45]
MLTDIEITYFRSRIDDVLRDGSPTAWQRQFLTDIRAKIDRDGTKTKLSDKQLSMLRKLTKLEGTSVVELPQPGDRWKPRQPRFNTWRAPSRRWRYREMKWAAILMMFIIMGVAQLFTGGGTPSAVITEVNAPSPSSFRSQGFTVTDGDTIRMADGTPVRLVGFNTPEKFEPMCAREAELGNRASDRLRQLVVSGTSTVTKVACACALGTEGTSKCNFGRSCGILRVDGKDVAQTLIAEGLAVSFQCERTQCPKMPRPWCS